ncbi:SIR2 family protein [Sulfitobacter pacificus]|uniref:SIR2-like domain-containing protein n=1 Tax=Sulfitobacter pacificus TaxID=1499314 RepID=A0ABQ5VD60_9RHOB|nr:SIR2 family protein [Sulfitobacter pacificus]GLQ25456.1 hypothetical protein GCM10007927_02590 [Sulfitobacter pacificus]
MTDDAIDIAEQFEKALNIPKQTWLLSAGASFQSNVPLMYPLTRRVLNVARSERFIGNAAILQAIDDIVADIDEGAHIEVFLTHLADLISMCSRARDNTTQLGGQKVSIATLGELHLGILEIISKTVRWGYSEEQKDGEDVIREEIIGDVANPKVTIDAHLKFTDAVFSRSQAGMDALRGPVEFFTTNYDTLIEDALSLRGISVNDGFTGGGVAYWDGYNHPSGEGAKAIIIKLHGSIDWISPKEDASKLLRVRHSDLYPTPQNQVVIYPQSTKYVNTQLDPFAQLFSRFRSVLSDSSERVLLVCGYSFGDEHINQDIEVAMSNPDSQLTLIAFSYEGDALPETLRHWMGLPWGNRIYVASNKGLYNGSRGPHWGTPNDRSWWTFEGVTNLLANGLPKDIQGAFA